MHSYCQVRKHTVWRLCIKLATYLTILKIIIYKLSLGHPERGNKIFFGSVSVLSALSHVFCAGLVPNDVTRAKWQYQNSLASVLCDTLDDHCPTLLVSASDSVLDCCVNSIVCYLLHFEIEPDSRESSSPLVNWLCKLIHHQSYATNDLSKVLWRDLLGSVGILKMTSTQSVFLGRVASAFLLKSCLPPQYHAKKPTHTQTHMLDYTQINISMLCRHMCLGRCVVGWFISQFSHLICI